MGSATMIDGWTPEAIAAARARLELDTDPVRVEAEIRARAAQAAEWGTPARCETNQTGHLGECLLCGDEQGERARCRR